MKLTHHLRAGLAAAERHYPGSDNSALRRELRAARLADTISNTLTQTPPLTAQERCTLAALLLAGPDAGIAR